MKKSMDVKPIFQWAIENGDAKILDRILLNVLPSLIDEEIKLTPESINNSDFINVSDRLYEVIKLKAQELMNRNYQS